MVVFSRAACSFQSWGYKVLMVNKKATCLCSFLSLVLFASGCLQYKTVRVLKKPLTIVAPSKVERERVCLGEPSPRYHPRDKGAALKAGKEWIIRALKDPESARFRDVHYFKEGFCVEVNAKNAFKWNCWLGGEYIGDSDSLSKASCPRPKDIYGEPTYAYETEEVLTEEGIKTLEKIWVASMSVFGVAFTLFIGVICRDCFVECKGSCFS